MFRPPREIRRKRLDKRYEIGEDGTIYGDGCALVAIDGTGVNIHGQRKKIAYLVARAFVPNPELRHYVRHKNGDVKDNRAENLEWCERMESKKRGPKPKTAICSAWNLDGEKVGVYQNPSDASVDLNVNIRCIRNCLAGRQRTAGGYLWRWGTC